MIVSCIIFRIIETLILNNANTANINQLSAPEKLPRGTGLWNEEFLGVWDSWKFRKLSNDRITKCDQLPRIARFQIHHHPADYFKMVLAKKKILNNNLKTPNKTFFVYLLLCYRVQGPFCDCRRSVFWMFC